MGNGTLRIGKRVLYLGVFLVIGFEASAMMAWLAIALGGLAAGVTVMVTEIFQVLGEWNGLEGGKS